MNKPGKLRPRSVDSLNYGLIDELKKDEVEIKFVKNLPRSQLNMALGYMVCTLLVCGTLEKFYGSWYFLTTLKNEFKDGFLSSRTHNGRYNGNNNVRG